MATYIIGDIQGCFDEFCALLRLIQFDEKKDILWCCGDLVNRGPRSLDILRYIRELNHKHVAFTVLGNHDLHLLAAYTNKKFLRTGDTLLPILEAPDCTTLINWLKQQPILHVFEKNQGILVHAGIYPGWSLPEARAYAHELEAVLRIPDYQSLPPLFEKLYGNIPDKWREDLVGTERYRFLFNAFMRMRFCRQDGSLDLEAKCPVNEAPAELIPWFKLPSKITERIFFGHWSALKGITDVPHMLALDTGCVWGGRLTALRLEDQQVFSVEAGKT